MKSRVNILSTILIPLATAQVQNCVGDGLCYSIGVPEVVASTGSGNTYFQITAPTSLTWAGMGTGRVMSGSTMFIIYEDGTGNVTVSPRTASGHSEPSYDSSIDIELLAGSGVSGGSMTANFLVSTGDLGVDISSSSSSWIAGWRTGSSLDSSSPSASIREHSDYTRWEFDLTQAAVTDDSNPFVESDGDSTNGNTEPGSDSGSGDSGVVDGSESSGTSTKTLVYIHAFVAGIAFVIVMPFASLLMPLLGKWYIHAGFQLVAFVMTWVGFGLGVKVANDYGMLFEQTHTILGTVVICAMVLQPAFGWFHHLHFIKHQGRGAISYVHVWYGRILMALGVINGGLGLELAQAENGYKIAYGAVSAIMFIVYAIGKTASSMRKSRQYKKTAMQEHEVDLPELPHRAHPSNNQGDWRSRHGTPYDSNRYA